VSGFVPPEQFDASPLEGGGVVEERCERGFEVGEVPVHQDWPMPSIIFCSQYSRCTSVCARRRKVEEKEISAITSCRPLVMTRSSWRPEARQSAAWALAWATNTTSNWSSAKSAVRSS